MTAASPVHSVEIASIHRWNHSKNGLHGPVVKYKTHVPKITRAMPTKLKTNERQAKVSHRGEMPRAYWTDDVASVTRQPRMTASVHIRSGVSRDDLVLGRREMRNTAEKCGILRRHGVSWDAVTDLAGCLLPHPTVFLIRISETSCRWS